MLAMPNYARMNRVGQEPAEAAGDPSVNYAPGSTTSAETETQQRQQPPPCSLCRNTIGGLDQGATLTGDYPKCHYRRLTFHNLIDTVGEFRSGQFSILRFYFEANRQASC